MERALQLGFPDPQGLFDTYDDAKAAALFKTFVKNDTWHTPTLALLQGFLADRDRSRQTVYMKDLSPEVFDGWMARISALLDRYKKLVGDMHRAGVEFLAGTDTNPNNPVTPGSGLHDELELLVESGFTPMEALQTATRNPARYFGRLQDMGTIETGKLADLVLLDANPLDDIRNTRKISMVVLRGRIASAPGVGKSADRGKLKFAPPWRTHSCVPCRDSSRLRVTGLSRRSAPLAPGSCRRSGRRPYP